MFKKSYCSLLLLILISCDPINSKIENQEIPEIFQTNYGKIDDKNLQLKFGDIVEFQSDTKIIKAIVLDIKSENSENWFGLCFINDNKLFGRKIPNGLDGNCIDLFDLTYLKEIGLENYSVLKNENINYHKVGRGTDSPVINLDEIFIDYNRGVEIRKLDETPCKEKISMLEPINECYFLLKDITLNL